MSPRIPVMLMNCIPARLYDWLCASVSHGNDHSLSVWLYSYPAQRNGRLDERRPGYLHGA